MVNKVLQENKRIANLADKQVSANPSVNLRKGFVPPSIYKGKTLMDTMEAFQEKTGIPGTQYLRYRGRPMIGKQGGDKSLELINKVVDPKDRYTKIGAGQRAAEELITGPVKTMKNKPIRQNLSNFFETVQRKADDVFGAAQDIAGDIAKQEDKLKFNFGGNTLELDKSSVPEELVGTIDKFTSDIWNDYTRKSQANAETQKTLVTQRENVEKLMELNGDALQTYSVGLQLRNDIQQLQQVNMNELWQSNPDQARLYSDSLAQKQAEFQNIVSLVDQQENALNDAKQSDTVRRSEEGRKQLNAKVKDFETKVAPKLVDYVMKTYGWDQTVADRWDQNPDMTDMARKAMLYDQGRAKMKSASKSATTTKATPVTAMKSKGKSSGSSDPESMSMAQLSKHLKLS